MVFDPSGWKQTTNAENTRANLPVSYPLDGSVKVTDLGSAQTIAGDINKRVPDTEAATHDSEQSQDSGVGSVNQPSVGPSKVSTR